MILGNGLIGNSLKKGLRDHEDLLVFASGVSNSKEQREDEYLRELELLKHSIVTYRDKRLIYFSSCSIVAANSSRYNDHKKTVEQFIKDNLENYLILRLPNIVGRSNNRTQLLNYFYNSLINQDKVVVNTDCIRHLIDVEDLPRIVESLRNLKGTTLNVAFNNGTSVKEIVRLLEVTVGVNFKNIEFKQEGNDYSIDNTLFLQQVREVNFTTDPKKIIEKYFKNEN